MSRRKKNKKSNSVYLNEDFALIQGALEDDTMINLPHTVKGKPASSFGGTQAWSGHTTYHQSCKHEGDTVVFEYNGKKLYAASWHGLNEYSDEWDLIIDLAGNVKPIGSYFDKFVKAVSTASFAESLDKFVTKTAPKSLKAKLLSLSWPDMGIPPVGLEFWETLWAGLPEKTVVACQGGHGRTGSCLVALRIMTGTDYWSALKEVRKEHCNKAVESIAQEKYLHALYLDKLYKDQEEAIAKANNTLIDSLENDIEYAINHTPSITNSTASKGYVGGSISTALTDNSSFGKPQSTRYLAGGIIEDERCTFVGCTDYYCNRPQHMNWIRRGSGTALATVP